MEIYDLFMLGIVVVAALLGAMKGLAWQIASAAAFVGSYIVALTFYPQLAVHIDAEEPWNKYLAMFALYLGTSFVVWIIFAFVRRMIERVEMKGFDRQAGAIVGLVNGGIVCLFVTFFAITLPFLSSEQKLAICQSQSGRLMASTVETLKYGLPEDVDQVVRPYLEELDKRLQNPEGFSQEPEKEGQDQGLMNQMLDRRAEDSTSADKTWMKPNWSRFAEGFNTDGSADR